MAFNPKDTQDYLPVRCRIVRCQRCISIDFCCFQAVFGDKAQRELRDKRENERKAATQDKGDPNLIPLGVRKPAEVKPPKEPIPEVEWWDVGLMQNKLYEIVEEEITGLRDDKITIYVEHPVPLDPPAEDAQPPPMPLPLTQRVRFIVLACTHTCFWASCSR